MDDQSILPSPLQEWKDATQNNTKIENLQLKHNKTPCYRILLDNNGRVPWLDGHGIQFYAKNAPAWLIPHRPVVALFFVLCKMDDLHAFACFADFRL